MSFCICDYHCYPFEISVLLIDFLFLCICIDLLIITCFNLPFSGFPVMGSALIMLFPVWIPSLNLGFPFIFLVLEVHDK